MPNFEGPSEEFPLPDVKIGDKILLRYGKGHSANETLHVRGFVDGQIVLAVWSRRKQRFRYQTEDGVWWHVFGPRCKIVRGTDRT